MVSPIQPPSFPDPVQWVWFAVAGDHWPEGDEAALHQLAEHWQRLATALREAQPELAGRLAAVSSSYGGTAGQEFQFAAYDVLGYGGEGAGLTQLADAATDRRLTVQSGAMDIELAKLVIIMEALVTAIEVLYAIISSYLTLGATTVSVPALLAAGKAGAAKAFQHLVASLASRGAGRYALRRAGLAGARAAITRYLPHRAAEAEFRRLSRRGLYEMAREGVQELGEELFIAGGAQALQMLRGSRDWRDWDWDRLRTAAVAGFVGGFAGTAVFGRDFFGLGNRFMSHHLSPLRPSRVGIRVLQGAVQNPPISALGGWVASGFEGGLPGLGRMFVDGAFSAAVVGGVRSGLTLAGGALGVRLRPLRHDPTLAQRIGGAGDTGALDLRPVADAVSGLGRKISTALLPDAPADPSGPPGTQARAAIDEKVAAMRQLAAADRDAYRFLLAAGFTPEQARPVVAGDPESLAAARSRLRDQDAALAELLDEDPELVDAGATGELATRLDELATARALAADRNATADDQLAAVGDQLAPAAGPSLAQVQAALADQVRAEVVTTRVARAGEPSPVAEDLGRRVAEATAGRPRPTPQPLDEAVAYDLRNTLLAAGALPETAETLARQLAELRATGIDPATIDAFLLDQVAGHPHPRDAQVGFAELASALELTWSPTLAGPPQPAGALVDAVLAGGVVDEVNTALDHRRFGLRGRRGSVGLAEPAAGIGSSRRFSLWARTGLPGRSAELVVTEGTGPARATQQSGGRTVVRLDPAMTLAEASAFVVRTAADTIDNLSARGARADQRVLRPAPLPADVQQRPRTRQVTARDVVEQELRLRRPFRELSRLQQRLTTMDNGAPDHAATLRERDAKWREVRDGIAALGLDPDRLATDADLTGLVTGFPEDTRSASEVAADLRRRLEKLARYLPEELTDRFADLVGELTAEVEEAGQLRQLLTSRGLPWARAQELVEWAGTATPPERKDHAWRLLRELPGLPDSQVAQLRFRSRVNQLLDSLHGHVNQQQRRLVEILQAGMLGELVGYAALAIRQRAHAAALAPASHPGLPVDQASELAVAHRAAATAAEQLTGAVSGLARKVATRVVDVRWDRTDRWLRAVRATDHDRQLLRDAAGGPLEPLGLPPRRWHMLRRSGAVARAAGFGLLLVGPAGWGVAAVGAAIVATGPVVSGFAGRAYDASVRVTQLHRSVPGRGQALWRRVPPSVPQLVTGAFGAPVHEGLRGWRDVFGAKAWARAHAAYTVRALYKGEPPSDYNEPVMDVIDAIVGRVAGTVAELKHAMFRDGRHELTASERDRLSAVLAELDGVGDALETTARRRQRRYRQQRLRDRVRQQPPKGLPSGWTHQRRRAPIEGMTSAAEWVFGQLSGDSGPGAEEATADTSGSQSLALAEKWVATRRYRTESGVEAAALSRDVREVQAAVARLLDGAGIPERPGLHRLRADPAHWPVYQKRPMPDYAAHALRAHTAAAGAGITYLAWAGLGYLRTLPAWLAPALSVGSVMIGAGSAVGFSLATKLVDWRYREVKARAAFRQREAALLRGLGLDPPPDAGPADVTELAAELSTLRADVERWSATDRSGSPAGRGTTGTAGR